VEDRGGHRWLGLWKMSDDEDFMSSVRRICLLLFLFLGEKKNCCWPCPGGEERAEAKNMPELLGG
jgi:hypothetical protein